MTTVVTVFHGNYSPAAKRSTLSEKRQLGNENNVPTIPESWRSRKNGAIGVWMLEKLCHIRSYGAYIKARSLSTITLSAFVRY